MRINCLACGYKVDLDDAYDDYEGPVKCFACGASLEIHVEQGHIKAVKQVNPARQASDERLFGRVPHAAGEAAQAASASDYRHTG
jgi:DNA-directed RNA polymerase subunit N (RpoN/RPB10)